MAQTTGDPAHGLFAEAEDLVGDTAVIHNVARQDKEGEGHQGKGAGACDRAGKYHVDTFAKDRAVQHSAAHHAKGDRHTHDEEQEKQTKQ